MNHRRLPALFLIALFIASVACGSERRSAAPGGREAGSGSSTRTVQDATGTVVLPANPSRVVALDGIYVAYLLSLGIQPAAVPDDVVLQLSTVAEQLPEGTNLAALPKIGKQYEINMEALAASRPDLILSSEFDVEELGQKLRDIAPTYFTPTKHNGDWRERFRKVGEALGRQQQAAAVEKEYDAIVASLPASAKDRKVVFIRTSDPASARLDILATSFPGSVARGAGIPVVDLSDRVKVSADDSFIEISGEQIGLLAGADLIVASDLSFYDPALEDSLTVLKKNPLWNGLPAVKAGRVVMVKGPVYNGGNYQAATSMLRAIANAPS